MLSERSKQLEPLASQLREIVGWLIRLEAASSAKREIRALEAAFVVYRVALGSSELARVRVALESLATRLGSGVGIAGIIGELQTWWRMLERRRAPAPVPAPRSVTVPLPAPTQSSTRELDLLIIPRTLPSRAALAQLAGRYQTILIHGGEGAVTEDGAPRLFNGTPCSSELDEFFAAFGQLGITGRCVVADFSFSLAWIDRLVGLAAPGGFVVASWTAAQGALASAVLAGARDPKAVVERATQQLASAHRGEWFDSPFAVHAVANRALVRGDSAIDYVLLDPDHANANLAATHAMLRWLRERTRPEIRESSESLGLHDFVVRVEALVDR